MTRQTGGPSGRSSPARAPLRLSGGEGTARRGLLVRRHRPLARRRLRRLAAAAERCGLRPAISARCSAEHRRCRRVGAARAGRGPESAIEAGRAARCCSYGTARRASHEPAASSRGVRACPRRGDCFLHRLAAGAGATRRILELGSCGERLRRLPATAPSCERFVGVEGSPALATPPAMRGGADPGAMVLAGLFADRLDDALAPSAAASTSSSSTASAGRTASRAVRAAAAGARPRRARGRRRRPGHAGVPARVAAGSAGDVARPRPARDLARAARPATLACSPDRRLAGPEAAAVRQLRAGAPSRAGSRRRGRRGRRAPARRDGRAAR